jgi:membrane-bound ClpP family serine protease
LDTSLGLALIALGLALYFVDLDFDLEIPYGDVPGIAGGICVVVGAFLLFDDWRIGAGVLGAAIALVAARVAIKSRVVAYPTQAQRLVNQTGYTTTALEPRGSVQMPDGLWSAMSDSGEPIEEGAEVIVMEIDGLTLKVIKADTTGE